METLRLVREHVRVLLTWVRRLRKAEATAGAALGGAPADADSLGQTPGSEPSGPRTGVPLQPGNPSRAGAESREREAESDATRTKRAAREGLRSDGTRRGPGRSGNERPRQGHSAGAAWRGCRGAPVRALPALQQPRSAGRGRSGSAGPGTAAHRSAATDSRRQVRRTHRAERAEGQRRGGRHGSASPHPGGPDGAGRLEDEARAGRLAADQEAPNAGPELSPRHGSRSLHRRGPAGVVKGRRSNWGRGRGEAAPLACFVPGDPSPGEGFLPRRRVAGFDLAALAAPTAPAGLPAASAPAPRSGLRQQGNPPSSPSDLSPPPAARLRSDVVAGRRTPGRGLRTARRGRRSGAGHALDCGPYAARGPQSVPATALRGRLRTRVADPQRGCHRRRHREAEPGRSSGGRRPSGPRAGFRSPRPTSAAMSETPRSRRGVPTGRFLRQLRRDTSQDTSPHADWGSTARRRHRALRLPGAPPRGLPPALRRAHRFPGSSACRAPPLPLHQVPASSMATPSRWLRSERLLVSPPSDF